MTEHIQCPSCGRTFQTPMNAVAVRCLFCGAALPGQGGYQVRGPRRSGASPVAKVVVGGLVGCAALLLLCAGVVFWSLWKIGKTTTFPEQSEDYADARKHFKTKLVRQGPAPQRSDSVPAPPPGVSKVSYLSNNNLLQAWVSTAPGDGRRHPAVLYLHGGFAFGADDWRQAKPFRDAGFVVMTPVLRGENGQPGSYTMFYDEVDDVLAAADALAGLPYVDDKRLYVAGHSAGGTLTLLAALTSKHFRAAASFSGSPDQVEFVKGQEELAPFDRSDPREFQMRSPQAFARSFKCPTRLYYGSREIFFGATTQKTAELAKAAGLDVEAVSVPGDHFGMVEPAMRETIAFFQKQQ